MSFVFTLSSLVGDYERIKTANSEEDKAKIAANSVITLSLGTIPEVGPVMSFLWTVGGESLFDAGVKYYLDTGDSPFRDIYDF